MKIMLVGPTNKIGQYSEEYFVEAKNRGYILIAWSGAINRFININLSPDYYSFLDPLSIMHSGQMEKFANCKINKGTSLLLADLYENIFTNKDKCEFYKIGLTCDKANRKSKFLKDKYEKQISKNIFKKTIKIRPAAIDTNTIKQKINFSNSFYILSDTGKDTDKLTSFLLPLVFYYFDNIEEIKCLGFGDMPRNNKAVGRYVDNGQTQPPWVSHDQDKRFLKNFKKNITLIDKYMVDNDIELNFEYENEYSKIANKQVKSLIVGE